MHLLVDGFTPGVDLNITGKAIPEEQLYIEMGHWYTDVLSILMTIVRVSQILVGSILVLGVKRK